MGDFYFIDSIRFDSYRSLKGPNPGLDTEQLKMALHPQSLPHRHTAAVVLCEFLGGMAPLLDPTLCACTRPELMVQCPPPQAYGACGLLPTAPSSHVSGNILLWIALLPEH